MINISKREKWLIAAAGVAALFYILVQYTLLPYWDSLAETSEKIELQSKRVTSYRRVLQGQDSVKAALEVAHKQTALVETGLLASKSDALANAEIQGLVKDLATSKGLNFRRSDSMPVKNVSPEYGKVSTRVEIVGNIDQLVSFLTAFETAARILFVEEIRITPVQMGNPKNKQVLATVMISALKLMDMSGSPPNKK